MTVYISVLMFMDMNNFPFSSLVLFACPNTAQKGSLLVILNNTKFPLQNNIEVRIWASKTLTEKRFYFTLVNPLHFYILLYVLREYMLRIHTDNICSYSLLNGTQINKIIYFAALIVTFVFHCLIFVRIL